MQVNKTGKVNQNVVKQIKTPKTIIESFQKDENSSGGSNLGAVTAKAQTNYLFVSISTVLHENSFIFFLLSYIFLRDVTNIVKLKPAVSEVRLFLISNN